MARRKEKSYSGPDRRKPANILIVNDDADSTKLLRRLLEHKGYTVVKADAREEALLIATQELPRAIVIDLTHGGIGSNLKLLESLRHHEDERVATSRVVLIARQASNRVFSFQSGADAFITRPFHGDELTDQLGKILALPFRDLPQHRRQQLEGY